MMNNYGYQQYKQQSINTMTNGEMLILLYDEAVKRLTRAEIALKSKDFSLFDASIERTKEIVMYLMDTLDRQYTISAELLKLYDFFMYELSRLSAGRNSKVIEEIKPMFIELRNTFKEADKLAAAQK